jgi:hypothetical protein
MLKLAFISPIAHLNDISILGDFNLCLLHLLLESPEYLRWHKEQADKGRWTTLDNSTYELKKPFEMDKLVEMALTIGASEIVLPDVLKDKDKTIELSTKFLFDFDHKHKGLKGKIRLHGVVQGRTYEEWIECFRWMMSQSDIASIGIPDDPDITVPGAKAGINLTQQRVENRLRLLHVIEEEAAATYNYRKHRSKKPPDVFKKEFHLLGIEDPIEILRIPEWIRSIDSYSVCKAGSVGVRFTEEGLPGKEKKGPRVDMHARYTPEQLSNIWWNISMMRRYGIRLNMIKPWE